MWLIIIMLAGVLKVRRLQMYSTILDSDAAVPEEGLPPSPLSRALSASMRRLSRRSSLSTANGWQLQSASISGWVSVIPNRRRTFSVPRIICWFTRSKQLLCIQSVRLCTDYSKVNLKNGWKLTVQSLPVVHFLAVRICCAVIVHLDQFGIEIINRFSSKHWTIKK